MGWIEAEAQFVADLRRLTTSFTKNLALYRSSGYDEASVRIDYLNPFFRALGWDLENSTSAAQSLREVQIETRVSIGGTKKRADYMFRTNGIDRLIFEAKAPHVALTKKEAYQAQRYAFNLKLLPATLGNFEVLQFFVVGGKPEQNAPWDVCLQWHYSEYIQNAKQIWELFSREAVGQGSLERYIDAQPKRTIRGGARQGWLIKRDRIRTVDKDFLDYVESLRELLAKDIFKENPDYEWSDTSLNECVQRLIDRILFIRICEDRDIDTGRTLEGILEDWHGSAAANRPSLYSRLVSHFNTLDESFNGALFRVGHESEGIKVSDRLLGDVIRELSSEDSPYLFSTLPVEILGAVYEQFIGKVVRIKGKQIKAELKPEVRKAGGVYYTPRYIVNYIVGDTVGKRLEGKSPSEVSKLRFVDPSCGSGSFLIRVFERIVEHYAAWYLANPAQRREQLCYTDASGGILLTTHLKRTIVRDNIFGVDVDHRAVEVTMLSLYLKILEGETRTTMGRQQSFFPSETFLPDLSDNIQCGNSLVGSDFFDESLLGMMNIEESTINAFDWAQAFPQVMRKGGFDAVVGNPPYIRIQLLKQSDPDQLRYFSSRYVSASQGSYDIYVIFVEKGLSLLNRKGLLGYILPNKFLTTDYGRSLRESLALGKSVAQLIDFGHAQVFDGATTFTCLLFLSTAQNAEVDFACAAPPNAIAVKRPQFEKYPSSQLNGGSWVFGSVESDNIRSKMLLGSTPLLELPTLISRGSSSGSDAIFMLEKRGSGFTTREGVPVEIEKSILRTPVYATDFTRYSFRPKANEQAIFPYEVSPDGAKLMPVKTLSTKYPKAYAYLLSKRRALQKRKQFATWYSFSAPRNLVVHETANILVPLLANRGLLCELDGEPSSYCLMAGGGFSISILPGSGLSPHYILGLLNSELMFWFLRGISNKFRGGWITCTKQYIGKLPIKSVDRMSKESVARSKRIEACVKAVNAKKKLLPTLKSESERTRTTRTIAQLESMIDDLVYKVYDITDAERAIVQSQEQELEAEEADAPPTQEELALDE